MDALDEAEDIGGHNQEVSCGACAGIPVSVGSSTGNQDGGAGLGFDVIVANLHDEGALEDIPGFVIGVVEMARSDEARRAWWAASVSPFGDDEGVVGRAQTIARERWSDHRLILAVIW